MEYFIWYFIIGVIISIVWWFYLTSRFSYKRIEEGHILIFFICCMFFWLPIALYALIKLVTFIPLHYRLIRN